MHERQFKYILLFLFGLFVFLPFDSYASEMYWTPYDIVIQQPGDNNVVISANRYTLNNLDYWSFPPNQSSDFSTPASIYFRYNNGNNDYCIYQANNGSVSGQFYASNAFNANHGVKVQDRSITSRPYFNCNSTLNSNTHYLEFTCNNLNLSHNYNFIITNANAQRYGIRANVNVECQQTIEGATSAITGAINEQTQVDKDIKNNTKETNDLLKDDTIDNTKANSFFGTTLPSNSSLTSVITAPISFIQHLSNTCSPVSIPINNKNITLPCGDEIFWNKPEVQPFRVIWITLIGGSIFYVLALKLFDVVHNALKPNSDKVERMDV